VAGRAFCGLPWCGMNPLSFAASMSPMIGHSAGHRRGPCQSSHTELTVAPASLNFPKGSASLIGRTAARVAVGTVGRRAGAPAEVLDSLKGRQEQSTGGQEQGKSRAGWGWGCRQPWLFPRDPVPQEGTVGDSSLTRRDSTRPKLESSQGLVRSRFVAKWPAPCQSQLHSSASSLGSTRQTVFPKCDYSLRGWDGQMGSRDRTTHTTRNLPVLVAAWPTSRDGRRRITHPTTAGRSEAQPRAPGHHRNATTRTALGASCL
jgi:hypothetical protein